MSTKFYYSIFTLLLGGLFCCKPSAESPISESDEVVVFQSDADDRSIDIITKMEKAMGGRPAYNKVRYLSWTFFGNRKLWWDKHTGRVRIENPRDTSVYLVNVNDQKGSFASKGVQMTGDTLTSLMSQATSIWINDSYWLVMPWKLRDNGVIVRHIGVDTLTGGAMYDLLQLTFDGVGVTPDNKYVLHVDQSDHLIKQWSFYKVASDTVAARVWPWDNYQQFGEILLSSDRSDQSGPSEVKVYDDLPDSLFEEI